MTDKEVRKKIFYFIKIMTNLMNRNDVSISELSEEAMISLSTIYTLINNQAKTPRLDTMIRIFDVLGAELVIRKKEKGE